MLNTIKMKTKEEQYPWTSKAMSDLRDSLNGSDEFEKGADAALKSLAEKRVLPSKHQIGDKVKADFHNAGVITSGEISEVKFSGCSVTYDILVTVQPDMLVLLLNIPAGYVVAE